jgi:hypothetical protein
MIEKKASCHDTTRFLLYLSGSVILQRKYTRKIANIVPKNVIKERVNGKRGFFCIPISA